MYSDYSTCWIADLAGKRLLCLKYILSFRLWTHQIPLFSIQVGPKPSWHAKPQPHICSFLFFSTCFSFWCAHFTLWRRVRYRRTLMRQGWLALQCTRRPFCGSRSVSYFLIWTLISANFRSDLLRNTEQLQNPDYFFVYLHIDERNRRTRLLLCTESLHRFVSTVQERANAALGYR
jgi:hypothetical protein